MVRYVLIFLSFIKLIYSGVITTAPTLIPNYTGYINSQSPVSSCLISSTNQIIYTWVDTSNNVYYIFQNANTKEFSNPTVLDNSGTAFQTVNCCYNSKDNSVIFTWGTTNKNLTYATLDIATELVSTNTTTLICSSAFCCYNPFLNKIIISYSKNLYAAYVILDENGLSSENVIDNRFQIPSVYCCSTNHDTIMFSYCQNAGFPYAALLKLATSSLTLINFPFNDQYLTTPPYLCYDIFNQTMVFSWADPIKSGHFIVYDLKKSGFQTKTYQSIPGFENCNNPVFSCYNSLDREIVFTSSPFEGNLLYAIYNPHKSAFTLPGTPLSASYENSATDTGITPCYNSLTNEIFFSWGGLNPVKPYYSIYTAPIPPSPKHPYLLKAIDRFSLIKPQKGI